LEDEPPVVFVAEEIPLCLPILEIERIAATGNQPKPHGRRDRGEKSLFQRERAGLTSRFLGSKSSSVASPVMTR